jgi:hypothetical protein
MSTTRTRQRRRKIFGAAMLAVAGLTLLADPVRAQLRREPPRQTMERLPMERDRPRWDRSWAPPAGRSVMPQQPAERLQIPSFRRFPGSVTCGDYNI